MWSDLNNIWQEVFSLSWESFRKNTIPIGAVIVDENENIISRGRNRIYDLESKNPLAGSYMAHAEMTAMINLKVNDHPNVKRYKLYSSMEPCPMCFGTMVMMGIRTLFFAARDGFAGAAELNEKMGYIISKNISIYIGEAELEVFQICLQSSYEYQRQHPRIEEVLDSWRAYCTEGVLLGKEMHDSGYFAEAARENKTIEEVYDYVISMYHNMFFENQSQG